MSALRALRPATTSALRAASSRPASAAAFRAVSAVRKTTPYLPVVKSRTFGSTRVARGSGESDVSLSSKLQEEIQYESENAVTGDAEPEFLKEFKSDGVWEIQDQPGHDEVTLVRTFGNETIRILFSIADIDAEQAPFEGAEGAEAEAEEAASTTFPVRCSVTITKPSEGALTIDALAEEGQFVIDNISFYKDAKLATELTAEADWARRGIYIGPQFDHLDVNVQEEFEKFLAERGVSDDLALFVPEYAEWKEQKEYVKWLSNVKSFIEA